MDSLHGMGRWPARSSTGSWRAGDAVAEVEFHVLIGTFPPPPDGGGEAWGEGMIGLAA
jgi:hypothetical protein